MIRLLASFLALVGTLCAQQADSPHRRDAWDPELVAAVARLPVQDDGRVKPLAAVAAYDLYKVHGRRDMKLADRNETLGPVEWLLDVWFHPDQAANYPLFRIENVAVMATLGIDRDVKQSFNFEYLSYRELLEVADPLFDAAQKARQKERSAQTPVEEHILELAGQLNLYHGLHQHLTLLRSPFALQSDELRQVFGGAEQATLLQFLAKGPEFVELLKKYADDASNPNGGNILRIAEALTSEVQQDADPALFPPVAPVEQQKRWASLGALVDDGLRGRLMPQHQAMLTVLHNALVATDDAVRKKELLAFVEFARQGASGRGELGAVDLEASYHEHGYHYKALHWFLTGLVVVGFSWMFPRKKWLWWVALLVNIVPLGYLVADLTFRVLITDRPPITNLYDTFLFIPAVGVFAALVTEMINRKRLALSVSPFLGALFVMLARLYEVSDGKDTLREIPAVLRSNFWLATHVTTINIGYAAGMLAAFMGTLWLLLRLLRVRAHDAAFFKSLTRMTYGITAFGLVFSVVGTILGGVWAEDSWGRFWGWDPKENGALMICLSMLAMLHARMSGMVKDHGFNTWAGFTGIVIAFSWFHVNLLEVGLHSYGFSGGLKTGVWTYYGVQAGLLAVGAFAKLLPEPGAVAPKGAAQPGHTLETAS